MDNKAYAYIEEEEIIKQDTAQQLGTLDTEPERSAYIFEYTEPEKKLRASKVCLIAGIFFVVMLAAVIAVRFASITQINFENQKLEAEYQEKLARIDKVQVDILASTNLNEIAQRAENELDMHKPLSYQIVHIDADMVDQTEISNMEYTKEKSNSTWYETLVHDIKLFFGFI